MSSVGPIEAMLSQMRALSAQASGASNHLPINPIGSSATPAQRAKGFAGELEQAIKEISGAQTHAATQQQRFALGDPNVQLNDVMIDMQKASLGFQTAVQVRNKLVSAYQTIASMPL